MEDAGFMTGQNNMGRNSLETFDGGARLIDVGKEVPVPGSETSKIVVPDEKYGRLRKEEGEMAGGVTRGRDHLHGELAKADDLAVHEVTGRFSRPEMELFQQQGPPDLLLLLIESIPFHQNIQIGKRRRILLRDPERKVVEEIQMHEMVLVPVAEPDHLDLLFGAETEQLFPTRCGVDQDARTFDTVSYTHLTLPTNREV